VARAAKGLTGRRTWTGSWTGSPDNPSAESAIRAIPVLSVELAHARLGIVPLVMHWSSVRFR